MIDESGKSMEAMEEVPHLAIAICIVSDE